MKKKLFVLCLLLLALLCACSVAAAADCEHTNMIGWQSVGDLEHSRYCPNCGYTETADHTGGDGSCKPVCNVCGKRYSDPNGTHNMSDWVYNDDTQHYHYCLACGSYE